MNKLITVLILIAVSAFAQSPTPPTPTNLQVTAIDPYTLRFQVDPANGVNGQAFFEGWREQSQNGMFIRVAFGYPNGIFTDTRQLLPNTQFCYKVRSTDSHGWLFSLFTDEVMITTPDGAIPNMDAPGVPSGLTSVFSNGFVTVSWTRGDFVIEPNGVDQFYILQKATSPSGPWIQAAQITGRTFADHSVSQGTTYYYRVQSCNPFMWGNSVFSAPVSVTIPLPPQTPTPTVTCSCCPQ